MLGINGLNLNKDDIFFYSYVDSVSFARYLYRIGNDVTNLNYMVASKSGSTFETKDGFLRIKKMLTDAYVEKGMSEQEAQKMAAKHFIAVTDKISGKSELRRCSDAEIWLGNLFIHDDIGGRFSVLDDHALFTLASITDERKEFVPPILNASKEQLNPEYKVSVLSAINNTNNDFVLKLLDLSEENLRYSWADESVIKQILDKINEKNKKYIHQILNASEDQLNTKEMYWLINGINDINVKYLEPILNASRDQLEEKANYFSSINEHNEDFVFPILNATDKELELSGKVKFLNSITESNKYLVLPLLYNSSISLEHLTNEQFSLEINQAIFEAFNASDKSLKKEDKLNFINAINDRNFLSVLPILNTSEEFLKSENKAQFLSNVNEINIDCVESLLKAKNDQVKPSDKYRILQVINDINKKFAIPVIEASRDKLDMTCRRAYDYRYYDPKFEFLKHITSQNASSVLDILNDTDLDPQDKFPLLLAVGPKFSHLKLRMLLMNPMESIDKVLVAHNKNVMSGWIGCKEDYIIDTVRDLTTV